MAKIKKQTKAIIISISLIALAFLIGANITGMFGLDAITSARLIHDDGTTATILYEDHIGKYVDNSVKNRNAYAEICSDNPTLELENKYINYYIPTGDKNIELGVLPAQITPETIQGDCAIVDLDFSIYKSDLPAIISFGISDVPEMILPVFYDLTQITGFLKGNFQIDPIIETPLDATINVRYAETDEGLLYKNTDTPLVIGIRDLANNVIDSEITYMDVPVTLERPAGDYYITINNIGNPEIFKPIVTIINPTPGEYIQKGTTINVQVDALGTITSLEITVTWNTQQQILPATYNPITGYWEAEFINTQTVDRFNLDATAYDINGNSGEGDSYFFTTTYTPGPGGGGGSSSKSAYSRDSIRFIDKKPKSIIPDLPKIEEPKYEQPKIDMFAPPPPQIEYPVFVRIIEEVKDMPWMFGAAALSILGILAYFLIKEIRFGPKRRKKA